MRIAVQSYSEKKKQEAIMHACICIHVGKYSHTVTFSPEDKCSVICGDLKLQLPSAGHISDKIRGDEPLRIYVLQQNIQLLHDKFN